MSDAFLQACLSNLLVSLVVALAAWAVQTVLRRPLVAHLLWLLALVKLLTPPAVMVPFAAIPWSAAPAPATIALPELEALASLPTDVAMFDAVDAPLAGADDTAAWWEAALPWLWVTGSLLVLLGSAYRIARFHRLLLRASEPAPSKVQRVAVDLARRLGVSRPPPVLVTAARISPMVWWIGGRVRIFLPASLLRAMEPARLRWIVAHELAHTKRRDHLVRWLEWFACVAFWWNPVAWWARRNLRANEEVCCDALVLSRLHPIPHAYASSLLDAVELIAAPSLRPPAMASQVDSGGSLERRLRMIVSEKPRFTTPRWQSALVVACAAGLLPIGVAGAQQKPLEKPPVATPKPEREEVKPRKLSAEEVQRAAEALDKQVAEGTLSKEEARARMMELKAAAAAARKGASSRRGRAKVTEEEYGRLATKLKTAVAEGRLSEEQAKREFIALGRAVAPHEAETDVTPRTGIERYKEIEAKLLKAVEAGELDAQEVERKLIDLYRHFVEEGQDVDRFVMRADLDAAIGKVRAAVEAGHLTAEEAREKIVAIQAEADAQAQVGQERKSKVDAATKKLAAAVEAGEITQSEADEKLAALRQKTDHEMAARRADYEELAKQIEVALASGAISAEEARTKLEKVRREWFEGGRRDPGVVGHFRKVGVDKEQAIAIKNALVEAGLREEQMKQALGGVLRLAMAQHETDGAGAGDPSMREHFTKLGLTPQQVELVEGIARRVQAAQTRRADEVRMKYQVIEQRVHDAVKAGEITEEEGKKKLAELRKRIL